MVGPQILLAHHGNPHWDASIGQGGPKDKDSCEAPQVSGPSKDPKAKDARKKDPEFTETANKVSPNIAVPFVPLSCPKELGHANKA